MPYVAVLDEKSLIKESKKIDTWLLLFDFNVQKGLSQTINFHRPSNHLCYLQTDLQILEKNPCWFTIQTFISWTTSPQNPPLLSPPKILAACNAFPMFIFLNQHSIFLCPWSRDMRLQREFIAAINRCEPAFHLDFLQSVTLDALT